MKNKILIASILTSITVLLYSCSSNDCCTTSTPKKIVVVGSAELEVVPDEISMIFTLKEYLDANKQKVKLDDIKAEFLSVCRTAGVADSNVVISGYSGNERWDYYTHKRRRTEPDFMSSIAYSVKVTTAEKLDAIVASVNDNALDNFYISNITHSKMGELRREVKMNALKASKEKAQFLAQSIGENIGEALLIQEIDNSYYSDVTTSNIGFTAKAMLTEDMANGGGAQQFEKIKIRYEMNCEYALK